MFLALDRTIRSSKTGRRMGYSAIASHSARRRQQAIDWLLMANADLSGVAIVSAGNFNPAIIHPRWLAEKSLIPDSVAEHAMNQEAPKQMLVSSQIAVFVADWLSVQVTPEQAVFATVDEGRAVDLRDFVRGVFELLPETPVHAIGINSDTHFKTASEEAWHAFGDQFLPKGFWEPIFETGSWRSRSGGNRVGMRVMSVEVHRDDDSVPGFVRVELAPSIRIPNNGVYIGINAHFQLAGVTTGRTSAADASRVLVEYWDETRDLEASVIGRLLEAV